MEVGIGGSKNPEVLLEVEGGVILVGVVLDRDGEGEIKLKEENEPERGTGDWVGFKGERDELQEEAKTVLVTVIVT